MTIARCSVRSENNYYSEIKDVIPQRIQNRPLPPINCKDENPESNGLANNNDASKSADYERLAFKDGQVEAKDVNDVHMDIPDEQRQPLDVTDDEIIMHENDDIYNSSSSELSDVEFGGVR